VANPAPRAPGTFDTSSGVTGTIATSLQDAINDTAMNPQFAAAGIVANRAGSGVALSRANPALPLALTATNMTMLQAVIGDFAAGSLSRQVTPQQLETFAAQVIRWLRLSESSDRYWNYSDAMPTGTVDPGFEYDNVTEDLGLILFDELDAQAELFLGPGGKFWQLPVGPTYPVSTGTQVNIVLKLYTGTLVSAPGGSGLTSAELLAVGLQVMKAVKAAYWYNYPNHIVWSLNVGQGPSGTGTGEPEFSDPAHQIANPNIRTVVTAFTYRRWPIPIRWDLENYWSEAMVMQTNSLTGVGGTGFAGANGQFQTLTTAWNNKTLIDLGS
jgi:hypothetical protein